MMTDDQDFTRELRLRCLELALSHAGYMGTFDDPQPGKTVEARAVEVAATFAAYVLHGGGHQPSEPETAVRCEEQSSTAEVVEYLRRFTIDVSTDGTLKISEARGGTRSATPPAHRQP